MPVLFSEFGVPTLPSDQSSRKASSADSGGGPRLVSEIDAAKYVSRSLRALEQSGASGAMLWCFSDYAPHLFASPPFDAAPHERSFGLFRADGSAKPAVEEVLSFSLRHPEVAAAPRVRASDFIDLTIDDYYDSPKRHLGRLFRRYSTALGELSPFNA
jgi:endo-1,4-beta-mannosidase